MGSKGKEIDTGKGSSGKRKLDDSDKTGRRKRKKSGVLQFFEDAAYEVDEDESSDDSDFDDDFLEDEFGTEFKVKNEPGKAPHFPFLPKEEEMTEEELEKMLEERYKPGSSFVTYAEDGHGAKRSIERNAFMPAAKDPTIWKVKCMVGRERHSAFCLMQKFVDLHSLGTKLQIISAFVLEHVKGFIYIEADKQCDVNEACKGLCSIYSSRVAPVPKNEVSHLLSVRSKYSGISEGMWARVKNGKYKGDLAQVAGVNDARKKATVKLIPRIDLQAMAEKFGGGVTAKKTAIPAPKLISSSELEEFRPLIQYRRDRDTGKMFEVLDGMMLKDGYLYKKVSIDSLSFWGVMASEDELLKFEPSKNDESNDLEWLSQLYGERKKKRTVKSEKGGGKGEGASSSSTENSFEVHDLVFFGRKDFGVITGTEKDDSFKILKEGSEGPVVVTVGLREVKKVSFDKKFNALDQRMKPISVNDIVRVLEGPLQGRQGIVKQIYRGTIFLYDENEQENSGYFCSKAQMCEKIKLCGKACNEKGGEPGAPGFEDSMSSPKSPLSPKKPWQERDNNRNFNREDKDGMFSVGQSLRIRMGPLKGYLCRVLAVRHSDVTVKLDSQHKVLTVKSEHLSEVRGKSSAISMSENQESVKAFDLLGTQDGSRDWMDGAGTSTEGDRWNAGGLSTERSSWPAFPASSFSLQPESGSANPINSVDNNPKNDVGDAAWETKVTPSQNSSWGAAVADENAVANAGQVGGWGKSEESWNKTTSNTGFGSSASQSWDRAKIFSGDQVGSSKDAVDNWGNAKLKIGSPADSSNDAAASWGKTCSANNNQDGGWKKSEESWDKGKSVIGNPASSWNSANAEKSPLDSWGKGKDGGSDRSTWAKAVESLDKGTGKGIQEDSWGKAAENLGSKDGSSGSKAVWDGSGATPARQTGGWGTWKKATDANAGQTENRGNMKKIGEDATGCGNNGFSWGKAVESQDKGAGQSIQEDSWGKAAEKWSNKDGHSGSKATWNDSSAAPESQTGRWGNAGGSGAQPDAEASGWKKAEGVTGGHTENWGDMKKDGEDATGWGKGGFGNQGQTESRNKPKGFGADGGSSWNKQDGGSSWNKQDGGSSWSKQAGGSSWSKQASVDTEDDSKGRTDQNDSWERPKSFGGDRGFGGWNKGRMGNKDETDQQSSWERPKTFDGDRGLGGRRGRGSGRGGRDQFGRGRSFNQGQSSGWSKGQENFGSSDGTSTGNLSSWSSGQAGGWGKDKPFDGGKKDDSWNKPNASGEDNGPSWNKGWDLSKETGESEDKWNNSAKPGFKSGWNSDQAERQDGDKGFAGSQSSGWRSGGNWNTSRPSDGNQSSGWNKGSVTNEESGGSKGQGGSWKSGKASTGDQGTGWKIGMSSSGGNQSDWDNKSSGWGNSKVSNEDQASSWNKKIAANEEAGGAGDQGGGWDKRKASDENQNTPWKTSTSTLDGNQPSAWGSKSSWNTQKDGEGKDQGGSAPGWGQSSWSKSRASDAGGNQDSTWGNKNNWNSGNAFGGSGNQSDTFGDGERGGNWRGGWGGRGGSERGGFGGRGGLDRGGFRGRGGSDRGGFGGRGGSDRGGFGGRGGADRGGFRGRGGSDRGGFGGRGRGRRDQSGDWNNRNDSGEDKPYGWNKGSNNDDGEWKSNNSGGSWNQGGGDKGQRQSWSSGWKPSKGAAGSEGDPQVGGWNKGIDSAKEAGGSDVGASSWNSQGNNWKTSNASGGEPSSERNQPTVSKEAGGWNNHGSGWNRGTDSGNGGASGAWNQSNAAGVGQSSGWNQPGDAKAGASEGGGATDSWGKAAANSWGKGNDGGSKGGW